MASSFDQQWSFAQRIEKELGARLKEKDARLEDVEHLIQELRVACETAIFLDIDTAASHKVELHLWDSHVLINNRYRKIVARYRNDDHRKLVVEKRKWEKRYADFLKTSQFFYKGFIQRLASHYGIPELQRIAHRLQLNTISVESPVECSTKSETTILFSCYATLLRLGDLSRYRNVLRTKERSFEVALEYYGLANDLSPDSGNAFNQMAVISLQEGDHLDAVYYLHRALAIREPNAMAQGNLAIEFKKIITEWTQGSKKSSSRSSHAAPKIPLASAALVSWFVRLHAKLYKGEEFNEHDELENEVLSQLTVLLKEQSLEGVLDKIVLINIAAEYCAGERLMKDQGATPSVENVQSYYFLLRLNVRMLFMLLQLLQPELAGPILNGRTLDLTGSNKQDITEPITAVTRRILPALRQYSIWLVSRADIIVSQDGNTPLNIHIKEMWSMYCSTLTMLVNTFPPQKLPTVDYLLEEDAATIGFKPFRDSTRCDLYMGDNGLKPHTTDAGIERSHPNVEMLARIRDLLKDGMVLAVEDNYPINLIDDEFRFAEEGLPLSSSTHGHSSVPSVASLEVPQTTTTTFVTPGIAHPDADSLPRVASVAPSDSHQSMSTDMHRMVDDLLNPSTESKKNDSYGSNETSYGMHSSTIGEMFTTPNLNDRQVSRHQISPLPFALGQSIWGNSPFSPQPGELQTPVSDQAMAAMRLSNLPSSNRKQDVALSAPAQKPGQNKNRFSPWGSTASASGTPSPHQQIVGQILQNSLAEQYAQSSMFCNDSSIYAGTPYEVSQPSLINGGTILGTVEMVDSTSYSSANYETMLQSSLWNGSQPADFGPILTPPGGQGG